jgi:hypothetical protein
LGEFQAWFSTDADCLDYLEWLRRTAPDALGPEAASVAEHGSGRRAAVLRRMVDVGARTANDRTVRVRGLVVLW